MKFQQRESQYRAILKRNQTQTLMLKIITRMKNTLEGLNNRSEYGAKKLSQLKGRPTETLDEDMNLHIQEVQETTRINITRSALR